MSLATTSMLYAQSDTDAHFREWGKGISDQISAMGWLATSDTGQINWATVAKPASASSSGVWQGYEIWKSDDGVATMFIKIEYGSRPTGDNGFSTGDAATPGLAITIGSGSNGSGTLTGLGTRFFAGITNTGLAATYNCIFSGSTSRIGVYMWNSAGGVNSGSGAYQMGFFLERTKAADGTDTADGMLLYVKAHTGSTTSITLSNFGWVTAYLPFSGSEEFIRYGYQGNPGYGVSTGGGFQGPKPTPDLSSGVLGSKLYLWPCVPQKYTTLNPGFTFLLYFNGDFAVNTTGSISVYGGNHTYYFLGSGALGWMDLYSGSNSATDVNVVMAMRYE